MGVRVVATAAKREVAVTAEEVLAAVGQTAAVPMEAE